MGGRPCGVIGMWSGWCMGDIGCGEGNPCGEKWGGGTANDCGGREIGPGWCGCVRSGEVEGAIGIEDVVVVVLEVDVDARIGFEMVVFNNDLANTSTSDPLPDPEPEPEPDALWFCCKGCGCGIGLPMPIPMPICCICICCCRLDICDCDCNCEGYIS